MSLSPWITDLCRIPEISSQKNLSPWKVYLVYLGTLWKTHFPRSDPWQCHCLDIDNKANFLNVRYATGKRNSSDESKGEGDKMCWSWTGGFTLISYSILWGRCYYPNIPKKKNWVWKVKEFALFCPHSIYH